MSHRRGSALAMVLMVLAIAAIVAFSLATSTVLTVHVEQWSEARTYASNQAESAIAIAAANMLAALDTNQTFPTNTVSLGGPGALTYLTFDPLNPDGMLWSYNNITGTAPATSAIPGQVVPPGCVQLIGTGTHGTVMVQMEAIISYPPFPYVVACSGRFLAPLGGVTIAHVKCGAILTCGLKGLSKCCILPGDLVANSACSTAICLGPGTLITGTAQAVGGIHLAPGACVAEVQPGASAAWLPSVNVHQDPTATYSGVQLLGTASGGLTLTGLARASNGTVIGGNLTLNGGLLYVQGDLVVTGQIAGTGAIIATGQVLVSGGAALKTSDIIALEAGGNVTLQGLSCNTSTFFGLVYTQGNFVARNLQLYGNFVAAGCCPCTGNVTMCNVTMAMVNNGVSVALGGCIQMPPPTQVTQCCPDWHIKLSLPTAVPTWSIPYVYSYMNPWTLTSGTKAHVCISMCKGHKMDVCLIACCKNAIPMFSGSFCIPPPCCSCPQAAATYAACFISSMDLVGNLFHNLNPNNSPTYCPAEAVNTCPAYVKSEIMGAMHNCACPQVLPSVSGPLVRLKSCQTTEQTPVYNFNFNQYISPANTTRILLWREVN